MTVAYWQPTGPPAWDWATWIGHAVVVALSAAAAAVAVAAGGVVVVVDDGDGGGDVVGCGADAGRPWVSGGCWRAWTGRGRRGRGCG